MQSIFSLNQPILRTYFAGGNADFYTSERKANKEADRKNRSATGPNDDMVFVVQEAERKGKDGYVVARIPKKTLVDDETNNT